MIQPKPIPPEIAELFDYLMFAASTGNLGVISVFDKGRNTRFALFVRHRTGPGEGDYKLVPVGFLSNTAGDEVIPPGSPEEQAVPVFILQPDRWEEFLAYRGDDPAEIDRWADDGGLHG